MGLIAAVSALISGVLTHRFTTGREDFAAKRQAKKDKVDSTRDLYVDAVAVLDAHISNMGQGDSVYGERLRVVNARMELSGSLEVRELYSKAANLIDDWAAHERAGRPRSLGNGLVAITSDPRVEEHATEAARLHPVMWKAYAKLKEAMREDIRRLEPL